MGRLIYTPEQFAEPNLLIPGKKPVGPVKASGSTIIAGCHQFGRGDLSGSPGSVLGGATIQPNGNLLTVGIWGEAASTADRYEIDNAQVRNVLAACKYTVLIRLRRILSASNTNMFSAGNPNNSDLIISIGLNDTEFKAISYNGAWNSRTISTSIGNSSDWITLVAVFDGSIVYAYADGQVIGDTAFPVSSVPSAVSQIMYVGNAHASSNNDNFYSEDAEYEFYYLFNEVMSASKALDATRDPYQFLVPA